MSNIEKFKFNPPVGFNDSNAYPNPVDEESVREQLQRPHNQTRDYINRLTTLLEEKGASFIVTSDGKTIEQALKEIAEAQVVSNYNDLSNKPSINGFELNGNASLDDLGLTDAIERSTAEAITKIPLASYENYGLVKVDSRTAASENYVTVTHARDAGRNEAYFVPTIKWFNKKPTKLNADFLPVATTEKLGIVMIDDTTLSVDENGKVSATTQIPSRISETELDEILT